MFGYSVLRASQQGDFFHALFDQLTQFKVPIEGIHTETGPGVYEAAILYSKVLEAADRAVCFKTGVKEIASRHGIIASFMAKFNENLPGCSGHVHQSLWTADGKKNLFFDAKNKTGISAMMESYIAGQLFCLPHILPMFAPTVNSYKRLTEGAWAPTTVTWAIDNRTTALRVLPAGATATTPGNKGGWFRFQSLPGHGRLPGGRFVRHQKQIETENAAYYRQRLCGYQKWSACQKIYGRLSQAMKQSVVAKELFGDAFVQHFAGTREWEWRQFSKVVTDWELKRYFEII